MRLAWQCGFPHFRPMFEQMQLTSVEYAEIRALAGREPLHERRADMRTALAALIAAKAAGATGAEAADFLLEFDRPSYVEQSPEEMDRAMSRIAAAME